MSLLWEKSHNDRKHHESVFLLFSMERVHIGHVPFANRDVSNTRKRCLDHSCSGTKTQYSIPRRCQVHDAILFRGANLPLQSDDWKFHPVACLWSVEYWQDVEDSGYKETFDFIIEDKEKYRRFIIGNDPFGADYGKVVLLRLPRIPSSQHSAAPVEFCTMIFPEFIEFESLESWIRSSRTLTFDEYIQEWNGYLLHWRVLDDDTLEQQEKQTKIMSFANEQVRDYFQATGDTCAEAAWTRHSKEWEATVVPAIFNASLSSNTEDSDSSA
jgi:hypothetical protein